MCPMDIGDTADIWIGYRTEAAQLSGLIHAHFQNRRPMTYIKWQQR